MAFNRRDNRKSVQNNTKLKLYQITNKQTESISRLLEKEPPYVYTQDGHSWDILAELVNIVSRSTYFFRTNTFEDWLVSANQDTIGQLEKIHRYYASNPKEEKPIYTKSEFLYMYLTLTKSDECIFLYLILKHKLGNYKVVLQRAITALYILTDGKVAIKDMAVTIFKKMDKAIQNLTVYDICDAYAVAAWLNANDCYEGPELDFENIREVFRPMGKISNRKSVGLEFVKYKDGNFTSDWLHRRSLTRVVQDLERNTLTGKLASEYHENETPLSEASLVLAVNLFYRFGACTQLSNYVDTLKLKIHANLEQHRLVLERRVSMLESQLDISQGATQRHQSRYKELSRSHRELQGEFKQLQTAFAVTESRLTSLMQSGVKDIGQFETTIANLQDSLEQFQQLNITKDRQITNLTNQLEQASAEYNTLQHKYQTAVANHEKSMLKLSNQKSDTIPTAVYSNSLCNTKVVIVGGDSMIKHLLPYNLSNWRFISKSDSTTQAQDILGCDLLIIATAQLAHSVSLRFKNTAKQSGMPYSYFNGTSADQLIRHVFCVVYGNEALSTVE